MESALYGRMKLGKCIDVDAGYMGCQNDVLYLADRWCSGRQECTIVVPNQDLIAANTECNIKGFTRYMEVDYSCVTSKGNSTYNIGLFDYLLVNRCSLPILTHFCF